MNIRQRQAEGIAAAKKRGVKCGRPPISVPDNFDEIYIMWKDKKITAKESAERCGFSRGYILQNGSNGKITVEKVYLFRQHKTRAG